MSVLAAAPAIRLRTVFISDVHLGARECRAELLLEFLRSVEADTLALIGDIIDLWALRRKVFWPNAHNEVIRAVLRKAKDGERVIYVPGNHDEVFRELAGSVFGHLEVHRDYV